MHIYGSVNAGTNFEHKFLPTDGVIANIRKSFANNFTINVKLLKIKISTIIL